MSKFTDGLYGKQSEFFRESIDWIEVPRGGVDKPGLDALEFLFNKIKRRGIQVIEVGSWTGLSTVLLGTLTKKCKGHMFAIDHFKGSEDSNLTCANIVNIKAILENNLEKNDLQDVVEIFPIQGKYFNTGNRFDFIFIDGDHRYEHAKFDMEHFYRMLKPNGIICGHDCEYLISSYEDLFKQTENVDYTQCHTGVIRAVYEVFGSQAKLTDKGYIWWVQKGK